MRRLNRPGMGKQHQQPAGIKEETTMAWWNFVSRYPKMHRRKWPARWFRGAIPTMKSFGLLFVAAVAALVLGGMLLVFAEKHLQRAPTVDMPAARATAHEDLISVEEYSLERLKLIIPEYEKAMCSAEVSETRKTWMRNEMAVNTGRTGKPKFVKMLVGLSKRPGVVVDVGAMTGGLLSMPAADAGREVWALEPDPRSFKTLKRSSSLYKRYVHALQVAAGSLFETRTMRLHNSRPEFSCFNCLGKGDSVEQEVSVKPLDSIISQKVFLLKTDTQGFELEVLAGAKQVFDRVGVDWALVEIDPRLLGGLKQGLTLYNFFLSRGYQCFDLRWRASNPGNSTFGSLLTLERGETFVQRLLDNKAYTDMACFRCG